MRHKYTTTGTVLARTPIGEASAFITLLTPDLGLIRARAQSIRKPGAKLASALQTFSESDVILVRGKEGWRLSGAILGRAWFTELAGPARLRAGRITSLILRLVHGESSGELSDSTAVLFSLFSDFLSALVILQTEEESDAAECLAALRILRATGVDSGDIPGGETGDYSLETLSLITAHRAEYIVRINHGISASGL
jgi:recombinational DNA repair protein (RecF pathway)